jgi:hypothetical protein
MVEEEWGDLHSTTLLSYSPFAGGSAIVAVSSSGLMMATGQDGSQFRRVHNT